MKGKEYGKEKIKERSLKTNLGGSYCSLVIILPLGIPATNYKLSYKNKEVVVCSSSYYKRLRIKSKHLWGKYYLNPLNEGLASNDSRK